MPPPSVFREHPLFRAFESSHPQILCGERLLPPVSQHPAGGQLYIVSINFAIDPEMVASLPLVIRYTDFEVGCALARICQSKSILKQAEIQFIKAHILQLGAMYLRK
jgi:hypothetical protein